MSAFEYRDGILFAEDVPLPTLAADHGTPTYVYAQTEIEARYRAFTGAFAGRDVLVCFALKANGNLAVVRALADLGAGADVVSEGELRRALAAGVPPQRIIFSGVGKSRAEMAFALETGIRQLNVESLPELEVLDEVARGLGRTADVALRVNPDVDARTHEKITTGRRENKFGIDLAHAAMAADRARALPGIRLVGLAVHIGSQLVELPPFRDAFARLAGLVESMREAGHDIQRLDLGGGLGVSYSGEAPPTVEAYAQVVEETVGGLGCELAFEPGRAIVADAGLLLTRVLYVKQGETRTFVIVDAAMNDLVRPSMYDAYHEILPVAAAQPGAATAPVDIVGPVCETGDRFALSRPMPPLAAGDLLAVMSSGAYGAVMGSTYNTRPLPAEVMVHGPAAAVIRARQTYDALLGQDRLPDWMAGEPVMVRKATG